MLEKIVLSECGESATTLKNKKDQGKAVIVVMEKLKKDTNNSILPMTTEMKSCDSKLSELNDKRKALLLMLESVENDMTALNSRKKILQLSVTESEQMYARTLHTIESNPNNSNAIKAIRIQDKIDNLISKVVNLENCVLSSLDEKIERDIIDNKNKNKTSITTVKKVNLLNEHPARVSTSSTYLQEYVRTECQCMSLLSGRVVSLTIQLINLKRELNAYKSLNMTALAVDVEMAIKKMEKDIEEDRQALVHLQEDLCSSISRFSICLHLTSKGSKFFIFS